MRRVCCRIRCMLRIHGLLAARHKGNEGSNLNLSATQSELQRNQAVLLQESLKIAAIPQVLPSNRTGESVPSNPAGKFSGVFLWRAHAQSGFSDSIRRMQCDYMTMMRRKRLDFVKRLGMPFFLTTPFVERNLHPGAIFTAGCVGLVRMPTKKCTEPVDQGGTSSCNSRSRRSRKRRSLSLLTRASARS